MVFESVCGYDRIVKAVKILKEGIRSWNSDKIGNIDDKIKALEPEVE